MSCGATAAFSGDKTPVANLDAISLAAAKNPTRISSLKIFCQAAVVVIITNHNSGTAVIQAYLSLPDFTRIPVPTHKAIAASIWFAMPNNGHKIFTPPLGSITPIYKKYPQPATTKALVNITE